MGAGTVLITGASSGIGEALARKFAAEGFALIITARRRERLQALADELGGDITVVDADLGVPGGAAALIEAIADRDVSVLVNNAGVARTGDFLSQDIADIDAMLALNISALTTLTRHYAEQMAKRGVGRILNVASVAAFQPVPGMSLYAATKAFVLSLSEGLSEEFRDRGVRRRRARRAGGGDVDAGRRGAAGLRRAHGARSDTNSRVAERGCGDVAETSTAMARARPRRPVRACDAAALTHSALRRGR